MRTDQTIQISQIENGYLVHYPVYEPSHPLVLRGIGVKYVTSSGAVTHLVEQILVALHDQA